jgi:hypothetical protein
VVRADAAVFAEQGEPAERAGDGRPDPVGGVALQEVEQRPDQGGVFILPQSLDCRGANIGIRVGKADPVDGVEVKFDVVFGKFDEVADDAAAQHRFDGRPDLSESLDFVLIELSEFGQPGALEAIDG